jgi:hypothetical protein
MSGLWPIGLALAAVIALVQACALIALFAALGRLMFRERSRYQVLITEDGPALGSPLPPVTGRDARTHEPVAATQFLGRRLVVLFVSPGCHACDDVLQAVRARQRAGRDEVSFLIVVHGPPAEADSYAGQLPGAPVLADPEEQIFQACSVERMPLGLLVDPWGYVRMKGIVNTPDQLAGLIAGQGRSMVGLSWSAEGVREQSPTEAAMGPGAV